MFNNKFIFKIILIQLIGFNLLNHEKLKAFVPYYSLPSKNFLKKNSSELGKNAYQLLYFGQVKEGLALARLATSLDPNNEKLWILLAEAQISNKLYDEALQSIHKGKKINPLIAELYFAESTILINQKKIKKSKKALIQGLALQPNNINSRFQFGNILLIEKNYTKALEEYNKVIEKKNDFWQALNNKGLVYFEMNKILIAIDNFKQAIKIENNAEPILALAVCLQDIDKEKSVLLAKKALKKDPKYVSNEFREEQLWGEKLQKATEKLFKLEELKKDISKANLYKN